ncbi:MAG: RNA 2',3'-cyclic phosphodiesterase [Gammaproteobacteria bacterium]
MAEEHYFLALWPECALSLEIERLTRPFWESLPGAHSVSPPNHHLTLAFLGSLPPQAVTSITAYVGTLHLAGFDLVLERMGWFRRSRILYFAPSRIPEALRVLVRTLRSGLADAGFPPDPGDSGAPPPFVPHVTLARGVRRFAETRSAPLLGWPVGRLCLARSSPGRDYEILAEWRLSGLEDGG